MTAPANAFPAQHFKVSIESARISDQFQQFGKWAQETSQYPEFQQPAASFVTAVQDAGFRIKANSWRIMDKSLYIANKFRKHGLPKNCDATKYFNCLQTNRGEWITGESKTCKESFKCEVNEPTDKVKAKVMKAAGKVKNYSSEVAQGIAEELATAYKTNQANINSVATMWMQEEAKLAIERGCKKATVNAAVAQGW